MKKDELRRINRAKRNEMKPYENKEKSKKASENFIKSDIYKNSNVIMLYYPLGNETDTLYIFKNALADNKMVVFPVTDTVTNELTAVFADSNTQFSKGAYSVYEPDIKKVFDEKIDLVIVPGIAFDKRGFRVGFGKGCYDRFLDKIIAVKVGFCYDFQIVDVIENDSFDIKMDYLVSESGMMVCE